MAGFGGNTIAITFMSKLSDVADKFSHDGNGIFDQMAADDEYLKTMSLNVKNNTVRSQKVTDVFCLDKNEVTNHMRNSKNSQQDRNKDLLPVVASLINDTKNNNNFVICNSENDSKMRTEIKSGPLHEREETENRFQLSRPAFNFDEERSDIENSLSLSKAIDDLSHQTQGNGTAFVVASRYNRTGFVENDSKGDVQENDTSNHVIQVQHLGSKITNKVKALIPAFLVDSKRRSSPREDEQVASGSPEDEMQVNVISASSLLQDDLLELEQLSKASKEHNLVEAIKTYFFEERRLVFILLTVILAFLVFLRCQFLYNDSC